MRKITVTCEDGSGYEGELADDETAALDKGDLVVTYVDGASAVVTLASPATDLVVGE